MSKIIYVMRNVDDETGIIICEKTGISRSSDEFFEMVEAFKKYPNVEIDILVEMSDIEAVSIARKINEWHEEDWKEEDSNPTYEVSPTII